MATARITPDTILDGRLALFHEGAKWLAVADLHYGYAGAMRDAGGLFPLWGDETIENRLAALCRDYAPETLIINGDLVHGRVNRARFGAFLDHLRGLAAEVVLIEGNHDRSPTAKAAWFKPGYESGGFFFHHGHLEVEVPPGCIEVTGHFHPATSLDDGAGLRLKMPTLIQEIPESGGGEATRWVLPAFSPWAGGMPWKERPGAETRRWVCSPRRVFEVS